MNDVKLVRIEIANEPQMDWQITTRIMTEYDAIQCIAIFSVNR